MLKKDYEFGEVLNISNELDNNRNKLNDYNPRTYDKTDTKNKILAYYCL